MRQETTQTLGTERDYAISIKEVAKIASTSTRTIWREIERGKLHAIRYSEKRTRVLASELARYLGGDTTV